MTALLEIKQNIKRFYGNRKDRTYKRQNQDNKNIIQQFHVTHIAVDPEKIGKCQNKLQDRQYICCFLFC